MSEPPSKPATSETSGATKWFGVGTSSDPDGYRAGLAAGADAIVGKDARLIVVFASRRHDLGAVVEGVKDVAGPVPMVGCTTAGEIATGEVSDQSIAVSAMGGEGFSVATAHASGASGDLFAAGAGAARCIDRVSDSPHRVLLMLSDGLAGDQQEVVRGAYSIAGAAVPLVGGCAGDDLEMKRTSQIHDGEVFEDAVVAAAIGSDSPIGIGVRHGWKPVGNEMLITESSGVSVQRIDHIPALDAYLDRLDAPVEARTDPAAFTRFALTHPLGILRRGGQEVRFVSGADFEERSLTCIAEVPEGGTAFFMTGDQQSVVDGTSAACAEALQPLGGREPLGVMAFDCIARRGVLGNEGVGDEMRAMEELACGAPVVGFYSYGEIARTKGVRGFHNQTLVALALS